jgi:hypothetical protein
MGKTRRAGADLELMIRRVKDLMETLRAPSQTVENCESGARSPVRPSVRLSVCTLVSGCTVRALYAHVEYALLLLSAEFSGLSDSSLLGFAHQFGPAWDCGNSAKTRWRDPCRTSEWRHFIAHPIAEAAWNETESVRTVDEISS